MRSLQARMFLVFALIATLPLLALGSLALVQTRAALVAEVGGAHEEAAGAAAGFVDVYVENGRVLLEAGARDPALRQALDEGNASALARALDQMLRNGTYRDVRVFASLTLLDDEGGAIAWAPAGVPPREGTAAILYAAQAPPGRGVLMPIPAGVAPTLPIAARVPPGGNGTLVGELSLPGLGRALQAFAPDPDQAVYLAEAGGRLLYHPDGEVLARRPDWSDVAPVAQARDEPSGSMEHEDPALGERALAAYARIPRLDWVVVTVVPVDKAYEALGGLTVALVVLSGLFSGGILLASVLMARRIVRPVEELTEAARDLSEGKLHRRIGVRGRDELAQLGAAFNEMAARVGESLEGLRRSEARYRSLVESANDLIFAVQPEGTLSFMSPLAQTLLGRRPQEMLGRPVFDFVHPADAARVREAVEGVARSGEPVLFVPHRLVARDGSARIMLTTFSPVFEGGPHPARVLGVARDVTQERRQELVREKAFQMARLVSGEAALQPLATRGLALLLDVVGLRQGAAYLGAGEAPREVAVAGAPLDPPAAEAMRALALAAARTRETRRGPLPGLPRSAGLALPLLERGEAVGAVVLVDEAESLARENLDVLAALASQLAVGVRRSLFEQRIREYAAELETRVAERTRELTEKSREMEQFLYSVSHDLKAPLISIQGYAQGLEEDYAAALQGEGAFYLERIRRNATLMESLILDILELSRIGRVRERPEDVDANALLQDIAARLSDRFAQAGGELVVRPGLPAVHGERNRLDQLFTNLLDNALKYRHPARPPRVEVSGEEAEGEARFHVRDNGRGIPPQHHGKLFDVFQRIPAPGMDDPGGTGMGLAIVKRIVDTHGGRVWVESEEGSGTTFHLAIPLRGPLGQD